MAGELCSQPPLGVALIALPQRSMTSTWQVSPATVPSRRTVGSPVVGSWAICCGADCSSNRWT
jgi:hypothetical protein